MRSHSRGRRNEQVVRILEVLRDLSQSGGVDLYELAERFGTTVRTIRRDFDALAEAGLPLREEEGEGRRKRWAVAYRDNQRHLENLLGTGHYLALRIAMGQGGPARSVPSVFTALEDLSDRVEQALGPKGRQALRDIETCFHSYERFAYQRSSPDVFWPLVEATAQKRLCRITYTAPRRRPAPKTFDVVPLRLFAHDGAAYLLGWGPKHRSTLTLNLTRVCRLQVLKTNPPQLPAVDLTELENRAFGVYAGGEPTTFVLRFSPDLAPLIRERVWHSTQALRDLSSGGLELTFRCAASYEVTAWVASWRQGVEVVEPLALREELAGYGAWLQGTYAPTERRRRNAPRSKGVGRG